MESTLIIVAIAAVVMTIAAFFAGKYLILSKVWGCMATSLNDPISADALEHHKVIYELLKKI